MGAGILRAFRKAGVQATPAMLRTVRDALLAQARPDAQALADIERLLAAVEPLENPTLSQPTEPRRHFAADEPSCSALHALRDKLNAPHRPTGKALPRPRWSSDEPPPFGWSHALRAAMQDVLQLSVSHRD